MTKVPSQMPRIPSEDVGRRVRFLREANQYTRDDLAEKIDVSSKFLYEIETGKKGFSVDILYRISRILGASCDYIVFGSMEDKISVSTRDLLERFDVSQMKNIEIILEEMLKMNMKKKN